MLRDLTLKCIQQGNTLDRLITRNATSHVILVSWPRARSNCNPIIISPLARSKSEKKSHGTA
jgi:hypothetical protein